MSFKELLKSKNIPVDNETAYVHVENLNDNFSTYLRFVVRFNPEDWNFFPTLRIDLSLSESFNTGKKLWSSEWSPENSATMYAENRMLHVETENERNHLVMAYDAEKFMKEMEIQIRRVVTGAIPMVDFTRFWLRSCNSNNFIVKA